MITTNHVYSRIRDAVKTEYPNAYLTADKVSAPPHFPCVECVEMDSYPERSATTINLTDDQRRSVFEVQAYSNKQNGAALEAREIMDIVTAEFKAMGYRCTTCSPLVNAADTTIKRYVARYTRLIGGGDTLYDEEE